MALLLLAGCTDAAPETAPSRELVTPEPPPPMVTGARVGVILPPDGVQDPVVSAMIERQLEALAISRDDEVDLRVYRSTDAPFVGDLAGWLAEQRTPLICVLGDDAAATLAPLASLYRDLRFCSVPSRSVVDVPEDDPAAVDDGVVRVELRTEELGHLVGVAARVQADGAPVGLVLGGDPVSNDAFREGLLAGLVGAQVVEADTSGDRELSRVERTEAVVAADVGAVIIDGAPDAEDALAVVPPGVRVLAPAALVDAEDPALALSWTVRWDVALTGTLAGLEDGDIHAQASVGFREGAFEALPGAGARASAITVVQDVTDGLRDGTRDPRRPGQQQPAR